MSATGVASFLMAFSREGYTPYTDGRLNIVGWRFKPFKPDTFSDILAVYWSEDNTWRGKSWPITTYPGVPWLLNPMSKYGCAILVPGGYEDTYVIDLFKGRYPALIQARNVKVYRDNNLDSVVDEKPDTIQEGIFGIDIHKAGFWSRVVGRSSAGCQVFQKAEDFDSFMVLCQASKLKFGNRFTYTLLEYV
jgi:hypothetical protein